jgi:hypothetical protein
MATLASAAWAAMVAWVTRYRHHRHLAVRKAGERMRRRSGHKEEDLKEAFARPGIRVSGDILA